MVPMLPYSWQGLAPGMGGAWACLPWEVMGMVSGCCGWGRRHIAGMGGLGDLSLNVSDQDLAARRLPFEGDKGIPENSVISCRGARSWMSLACATMLPETGCCSLCTSDNSPYPLIPVLNSNSCHLLRALLRAGSWPKIEKHGPEPQLGLLRAAQTPGKEPRGWELR